jgi:iron complex outermembrane receptor protein
LAACLSIRRGRFRSRTSTSVPPSHDHIRQANVGAGYDLKWLGVGQLSLGIQKVSYRKQAERPGVQLPTSRSNPWLVNAAINVEASKSLVFYGSYSTGLEESPVAPAVASNSGFAPPAILTKQYDAGLRYVISPNVRLVAGVYQIEKPYYGLNASQLFTNLGTIRNRGIELSLTGTIAPGLNIVVGTVLMDATLSGEAVEQGLVGKRPVGSSRRTSFANIEYQLPGAAGVTAVVGYGGRGRTIANRMNSFTIDPANSFSLGVRYRFDLGGKPTSIFARVANLTDEYSYQMSGEGLYYSPGRRFIMTLTSDL